MYLHGGADRNIRKREIVGIFDMDSATVSADTKQFLTRSEKRGETEQIGSELPKAFIVTVHDGKSHVYLSQLSPATLCARGKNGAKHKSV